MNYYNMGQTNYTAEQVQRLEEMIYLINFGNNLANTAGFYLQAQNYDEANTKLIMLDKEVMYLNNIKTQYLKGKIKGLLLACHEKNTEIKLRMYQQEVIKAVQNIMSMTNVVRGINTFSKGTLARGQSIDNVNVAFHSGLVKQLKINLKGVEEPLRRIIVADKLERLLDSNTVRQLPNGIFVVEARKIVPFQEVIETTDFVIKQTGS